MTPPQILEIQHVPMHTGRAHLSRLDLPSLGIPSISPALDMRWRAVYKGKFLDPGENEKYLLEILRIVKGLEDTTTQRALYYALRGAHPEWTYKGHPLGYNDENGKNPFYEHLVMWIMEKAQLMTGLTMQSLGVWAAPRGYIVGDGIISTARRGRMQLTAQPTLGFDMADEGVAFATWAKKVIHFEKDAGLSSIVSGQFPRMVEAIFSTSQGQLTEAANKFLRKAEDVGFTLYGVHDGDPTGVQMQLMYGMGSKNNCYMPDEFLPRRVRPLGFYPTVGYLLDLPPEDVTDREDKIFNNLIALVNEKQQVERWVRRYKLGGDVNVLVQQRHKWEFQALNAIHETAPKIYILESLRVHNDEIKHVPEAEEIKKSVVDAAQLSASAEASAAIEALAQALYEEAIKEQLIHSLTEAFRPQIEEFSAQVREALRELSDTDAVNFREAVKSALVRNPALYAAAVVKALGRDVLNADFQPGATLKVAFELQDLTVNVSVSVNAPAERDPITKTTLVDAIERTILKSARERTRVVDRIRTALEMRFGQPKEVW